MLSEVIVNVAHSWIPVEKSQEGLGNGSLDKVDC